MKQTFLFLVLSFSLSIAKAQEKWDLRKCVEYALANNISVKQQDIQARIAEITLQQSKLAQYPNLSVSNSSGISSGRSIDPTSNQFTTQQLLFSQFNLSTNVTLFNWFSVRNNIEANKFSTEAAKADVDRLRNDIALNVASAYLLVLVSEEQVNISKVAIQQTQQNLENTRRRVEAGSLPELNAAEFEAQLARDSSTLITAQNTVLQNLLQLKALLNLDAAQEFDVVKPPLDRIPVESLGSLQPEIVYALALVNLPQQKINNLRIKAAQKNEEVAKAGMYPTISLFGGMGTNYANNKIPRIRNIFQGYDNSTQQGVPKVNVAGTDYFLQTPIFTQDITTYRIPFGTQFGDNFRQQLGLNISVPIFSQGFPKANWQRAKLQVKNLELQRELGERTLKQDIYRAFTDASNAVQKFNAAKKSVLTAEKAYSFAQKRYDVGLLPTIDFLTNQNNLNRAKVELALAEVDYVFRLKLLEFYKGQGIKLQ